MEKAEDGGPRGDGARARKSPAAGGHDIAPAGQQQRMIRDAYESRRCGGVSTRPALGAATAHTNPARGAPPPPPKTKTSTRPSTLAHTSNSRGVSEPRPVHLVISRFAWRLRCSAVAVKMPALFSCFGSSARGARPWLL